MSMYGCMKKLLLLTPYCSSQLLATKGLPGGGTALCEGRAHTLQPGCAVWQHRRRAAERARA